MAYERFANGGLSSLDAGIDDDDLALTVKSAVGFPTGGNFRIIVDSEIMLVTDVQGKTFTVTRAQEGTTARAFNTSGHTYNFEFNLTAKILDDLTTRAGDDVYVASITQAGTDDPVATVIKSTLSAVIVWTRTSSGVYLGTLTGAFVAGKTTVDPHGRDTTTSLPLTMDGYYVSTATVQLITFEQDGWTATVTIRVYPS